MTTAHISNFAKRIKNAKTKTDADIIGIELRDYVNSHTITEKQCALLTDAIVDVVVVHNHTDFANSFIYPVPVFNRGKLYKSDEAYQDDVQCELMKLKRK